LLIVYLILLTKGLAQDYINLLQEGADVIRTILLYIRDHPEDTFLIHCSLGKDRTGVVFAILLCIAGVSKELMAIEYSIS
jgi:protein tyrosine/serine phosphatase